MLGFGHFEQGWSQGRGGQSRRKGVALGKTGRIKGQSGKQDCVLQMPERKEKEPAGVIRE